MNILAIESSGVVASAAIINDDRLVAEYTMNNKKTHSQTLLPMIDEIMKAAGMECSELDAVAISSGPGSFTGLRIGSATAKGLGFALKKPLIEVPTLEALAWNLYGNEGVLVCPIMDARRQEVYTGVYEFSKAGNASETKNEASEEKPEITDDNGMCMRTLLPNVAEPLSTLVEYLNGQGKPVIFNGDAVPVYADYIENNMKVPYLMAPRTALMQRAGSVAELALYYFRLGRITDAADHAPTYLRVSQAEREKAQMEEELKNRR